MTTTSTGASVGVGDIRALAASWQTSLRAQGKSPKTLRAYGDSVRRFTEFLLDAGMPTVVDRITRDYVEAFITEQLETRKPATANVRYRSLDRFFKWLEEEGEIRSSPMAKTHPPTVPEAPVPVLSEQELRALVQACSGTGFEDRRDMALIRFMIDTGCRLGEVGALQVDDLDMGGSTATVTGKGSRTRTVAFSQRTTVVLDRYLRARNRQRQLRGLPWAWVGKSRSGRLHDEGIRRMLQRRAEAAGIEHIHPHQLRHTHAHRWLAAGGAETGLMSHNGWRSRTMLQRYASSTASQRAVEEARRLGLGEDL